MNGLHQISWRSYNQNLTRFFPKKEFCLTTVIAKFCLHCQLATPPHRFQTEFLDCWSPLQISASRLQHQLWVSSLPAYPISDFPVSTSVWTNYLLHYIFNIYTLYSLTYTQRHIYTPWFTRIPSSTSPKYSFYSLIAINSSIVHKKLCSRLINHHHNKKHNKILCKLWGRCA